MAAARYGQQREMEDPTMVGTLDAQIEMIWPLERPLLESFGIEQMANIADLGCGTAQFAGRVAQAWPQLTVRGLDLFAGHLRLGRERYPPANVPNLQLEEGDARQVPWPSMAFDLVAMRHLLHGVPEPGAILAEAKRILAPGGLAYVLAEDYQTLIFDTHNAASAQMFNQVRPGVLKKGTDLFHGRTAFRTLRAAGFEDVHVTPLHVDTQNTPRDTLARMLRYWRDGYTRFIADGLGIEPAAVRAYYDDLLLSVMDTERYASWILFAVTGRRPDL